VDHHHAAIVRIGLARGGDQLLDLFVAALLLVVLPDQRGRAQVERGLERDVARRLGFVGVALDEFAPAAFGLLDALLRFGDLGVVGAQLLRALIGRERAFGVEQLVDA
jgi:hypothetical protein